jgi:Ca-activated chloride channel family protein
MPISISADLTLIPSSGGRRYLLATIQAPKADARVERLPVHLGLVLDRSGSMSGEKIERARSAAIQAIARLDERDRFSVVVYENEVDVLAPSTPAKAAARRRAQVLLGSVEARGGTDLSTGWLKGCEQVAEHLGKDAVGRILLLTDGLANQGITSVEQLEHHARQLRARGIHTSSFGVGADFNEELLRRMAAAGGGNFYFIESAAQIETILTQETGEALEIVARDARLGVSGAARLKCRSGQPSERGDGVLEIRLGGLISEQSVEVLIRARFPEGTDNPVVRLALTDKDGALGGETAEIHFRRAANRECEGAEANPEVVIAVAQMRADRARLQALEQAREGRVEEARTIADKALENIRQAGRGLAEVEAIARDLEGFRNTFPSLSALERKQAYMNSYSASMGRSPSGRAMKPAYAKLALLFADGRLRRSSHRTLHPLGAALGGDVIPLPLLGPEAEEKALSPSQEHALVGRLAGNAPLAILFLRGSLEKNALAHWHPQASIAVVSMAEVEPELQNAAVLYFAILQGLRAVSPLYSPEALAHAEPRGCLFDPSRDRDSLAAVLRSGEVCPECTARLQEIGVAVDRVQLVCGQMRSEAASEVSN